MKVARTSSTVSRPANCDKMSHQLPICMKRLCISIPSRTGLDQTDPLRSSLLTSESSGRFRHAIPKEATAAPPPKAHAPQTPTPRPSGGWPRCRDAPSPPAENERLSHAATCHTQLSIALLRRGWDPPLAAPENPTGRRETGLGSKGGEQESGERASGPTQSRRGASSGTPGGLGVGPQCTAISVRHRG